MLLLPTESVSVYKDALCLLLLARVTAFVEWTRMHESPSSINRRPGYYWALQIPSKPRDLNEARRLLSDMIGKDAMLCSLLWLSLLADMEASSELKPEMAMLTLQQREAERAHHATPAYNAALHALPRRAPFGGLVASEALARVWFDLDYPTLSKVQVSIVDAMERGVDARGPRLASPLDLQLRSLERPPDRNSWTSQPPLQVRVGGLLCGLVRARARATTRRVEQPAPRSPRPVRSHFAAAEGSADQDQGRVECVLGRLGVRVGAPR